MINNEANRYGRAFMELHLPAFKEKNPQLEVVDELIRGQHPHLKGFYRKTPSLCAFTAKCFCKVQGRIYFAKCTGNKNQRTICVKNMDPEEILLHATRLRNALGRKVVKLKTRHVTKHPSVQGTWTTDVKF
jgi:large subunit ribosomal protein L43